MPARLSNSSRCGTCSIPSGTPTPRPCSTPCRSWGVKSRCTPSPVSRQIPRPCRPAAVFTRAAATSRSVAIPRSPGSSPWVTVGWSGAGSPSRRPNMPEPLLEVRDLKKYFAVGGSLLGRQRGWVKAVDGVSLTINAGETLGLVGESGCGKTTTSELILAAEEPTAGTITFAGRNLAELDSKGLMDYRRQVQVVFQDPYSSLSPRMRVGDIIGEPIETHERVPRREMRARVGALLELVGLRPDMARLFPHEFSGG